MTDQPVPAVIADLLAAARLAADFLSRGAGGDAGRELGESLRSALAGAAPALRRVGDADAVPSFVDTLTALVLVTRRAALPSVTGPEHVLLDGAVRAADELLAGWKAPIAAPAAAEVIHLANHFPHMKKDR